MSTQLGSEAVELTRQFEWVVRELLHISARDRRAGAVPLEQFLDANGWEERRNDNEDLFVLYGICKNYEVLVEALLETDSVMYNGDDLTLLRFSCMLYAYAWMVQDLASMFLFVG